MAGKKGGATAAPVKEEPKRSDLAIKVKIDKLFGDSQGKFKAIASANIGDFAVHGFRVYGNENGLFVSMPASTHTDANGIKKYEDIFHPVTAHAREELFRAVLDSYEQAQTQAASAAETQANEPAPEQVQKM